MTQIHLRFLAIILFLAASTGFAQGVRWEAKSTEASGEEARIDHFYYMPKMMKMVEGDGGRFMVIRLDRELMIMGDPKEKSYYQVTFAEMEQAMKQMDAAMGSQMEAMKEQLAQLPEEQRKMAEEMMGSRMKKEPKVEVSKTGETTTIAGYACSKYVVKHDGKHESTVWATKDVTGFEAMRGDMEEFARRMKAAMNNIGGKDPSGLLEGVDGFPLKTENADGWKSEVTKVDNASTPAAEFEAPAGYKKEPMPGMETMPDGH
jgi:hypothetical protein